MSKRKGSGCLGSVIGIIITIVLLEAIGNSITNFTHSSAFLGIVITTLCILVFCLIIGLAIKASAKKPLLSSDYLDLEKTNRYREMITDTKHAEKFTISDVSGPEFESLITAFEQWANSCCVNGNVKINSVSKEMIQKDLKLVNSSFDPYGIKIRNYHFYFFPDSIWVFNSNSVLVGIYTPKALNCKFAATTCTNRSDNQEQVIFNDTTIVKKYSAWEHTCVDGRKDRRYKNNPYYDFTVYIKCTFGIILCGYSMTYFVSSYDNCKILEQAILSYSGNGIENQVSDQMQSAIEDQPTPTITIAIPGSITNDADDKIEKIERLKKLLDSGAISQEEYNKLKQEII